MLKLEAKTRTALGRQNQALRQQGLIPAVVYGHKIKNQNIQLNSSQFNKVFEQVGETSLIDLQIDDQKPVKVIIQDLAKDILRGSIIHADLHQIREDEELTVDVELEFVGRSKAVEEKDGILVKSLDAVKIQCLPANLIHKIEVDISALKEFGDVIYVKDLKIPNQVKVLENLDEAVVSVAAPRSDKELEELTEKPAEAALPAEVEEKPASPGQAGQEEKKTAELPPRGVRG